MTDPILDPLDPEQLVVATSFDAPVVVLAGAGSGKTRAITHRVANAVRTGRYQPTATLAVTFTTRAAGEMRSRLAALGVRGAQARTIHAAALRQCQYFWPQAHGQDFPPVADNTFQLVGRAASGVLGNADQALVRDLEAEVSWAKSSNVTPEQYPALAALAGREVSGATAEQVAAVMTGYERAKQGAGVVDFHDILLCTSALLTDHPAVAQEIRQTYRHFVVDEYQDVSALQHRLVQLWADGREDLCVVGDPQQAIHAFAGARADFLTGFKRERPDAQVVRLVRNYRSTPQVVQAANAVLRVRPTDPAALRATRSDGDRPSYHEEADDQAEADAVASWLRERHSAGTRWSELAVLYRINAQSPVLEAALTEAGVPYTVRGSERFYDRAEVRQAVTALVRAGETQPGASPLELLEGHLASVGWSPEAPTSMGRQRERWESLTALRQMVVDEDEERSGWEGAEFAAWLGERAAWQSSPVADAVTLSTMHAAKGLEWDDVALIGVREGLVPFALAQSEAALGEERRLLHVGLTRARNVLRVSWPASSGRRRSVRSRFLASVAGTPQAASAATRRTSRAALCHVCGQGLQSAAERKLGRHQDCESDLNEELFEALRAWRLEVSQRDSVPAFVVFTDATLRAVAEAEPTDRAALLRVSGVGTTKADRYGEAVLGIVAAHRSTD